MLNLVDESQELVHRRELQYCSDAGGHVFEKFKYIAKFSERLELRDMPFDKQILQMKFCAEAKIYHMQFSPLCTEAGSWLGVNTVPVAWEFDNELKSQLIVEKPKGPLSSFSVVVYVQRKPHFYIWNVVFILFFITLASASAFLVKQREIADRAAILFSLLLACVGYKMVICTWMPRKPYLTFLDRYIYLSFGVLFAAALECISIAWYHSSCKEKGDVGDIGHLAFNVTQGVGRLVVDTVNKCSNLNDVLYDFEKSFVQILYGSWVVWHVLFLVYPRIAFNLVMLDCVPSFRNFMTQLYVPIRWVASKAPRCLKTCIDRRLPLKSWAEVRKENEVLDVADEDQIVIPETNHPYGEYNIVSV
eukprot:gnl/MRDRNA2_/MRDRNA2_207884_c0_seq1.p1 gnl/MRDRNA2_/MRDRNA2_207884_c0~~gnl/MRDRNA2_/MRDRNA2_207884_c0_seq1.p1  ORF type:complete len:361 (+),score=44.49 gnl/MRDRNA2_/MRDRNA2_207884_c0_seq1:372-1454(+)